VAGKSSVVGRLIDVKSGQPMANQNLSLPSVICPPGVAEKDKREQCVYAVDDAFDPSAITNQDGSFVFRDIPAGDYVMLIGNPATKYTVLANESKQPLIWSAKADQVLNAGDLAVDLP
jgi:hypothetical protein